MKIQPVKNTNVPKYAAAIAAAVSAGLLGGYAAPNVVAELENDPSVSSQETTTCSTCTTDWSEVELAGVMPVPTEAKPTETTVVFEGTSPAITTTEKSTTPVVFEGTSPAITTTERRTTPVVFEGTSPAITTTERHTTPVVYEGTSPAITTIAESDVSFKGETVIIETTTERCTTPVVYEGTSPAITSPPRETTTTVRLEGEPVIVETTTGPTKPKVEHELTDLVRLQKFLLGKGKMEKKDRIIADMDGDGQIDVFDLALMKRELIAARLQKETAKS